MSVSSSSAAAVADVLLGLGGNLGDPVATIGNALSRLEDGGVHITARSHWYRTAAWGVTEQPDFVNLCAAARTALTPRALLALIHETEAALGRERRTRWGPRSIDIDILTYDDETIEEPGLHIPHPHLTERAFVLIPLLDIAPDKLVAGRSLRDWGARVPHGGVERMKV
jgi:2-amino-4-hydroxy-6-hydroxymethyldihydropteridine diphosphokinase